MKRVAIFRTDLLALSETFIRDQTVSLETWQPILLGRQELEGGLATPGLRREVVPEAGSHLRRSLRARFWRPEPNLVARLKALEVDLVHVHFGLDATDIWPSVKAAGLKMVVTLHGTDINVYPWWWEAGHGGPLRRAYPRRLRRMARDPSVSFIAVSEANRLRAIEFGIPAHKVAVLHTGIDTGRFRPEGRPVAERENRILFVGRMIENKAPTLLAGAFAAIAGQVERPELTMIGGGPELEPARRLAQDLGIHITFRGPQPAEAVLAALHEAKVLCLPSRRIASGAAEGLPQVLLEAQACGVPVVASDTGGIPEGMEHGSTGYVFRSGDQAELQSALLKVLCSDGDTLAKMSAACRRLAVERFDLASKTRAVERFYDSVASDDLHFN
jgi:glycosyltransferase involved in cell wall biosynthesis